MIKYWQQIDGQLHNVSKENVDMESRLWVDARKVTQAEAKQIQAEYGIDQEAMMDMMDPDELSRIEDWDDYNIAIMRLPVFNPNTSVAYTTAPVGLVIFENTIITICWTDCEVLRDISANRIKGLTLDDFPAFMIRILARADTMFLRYLKEINRRANSIQNELDDQIENAELIQLLNIQKSLTFFTTSLKSNQLLLEKIRKTRILKIDSDDKEWLDDVEVDNRQAMEMADTYSQITEGIMDAFANVISNNMNEVMKKLTVISLVLMIVSAITSFWGMNIRLPFSKSVDTDDWHGLIFIIVFCAVSATFAYSIMTYNPFKKLFNRRKNKGRK
jgi:magnesium transporter